MPIQTSRDYDAFQLGCPESLSKRDRLIMFKAVQKGMGMKHFIKESWFDYDEFNAFVEKLQEQGVEVERRTYEDVLKTVRGLEGGMSVPFLIELKKEVDAILETIDDAPTKQSLQTFLEESIIRGQVVDL